MKRAIHTLVFFLAIGFVSSSFAQTVSLKWQPDPVIDNQVILFAKIVGATVTGGDGCSPALPDFIFNFNVGFTWPNDSGITGITPVSTTTCGSEGEGYNFVNAPGLINVPVNADMTGTRIDKNPVGGVTRHPFSWADDTWYAVCTVTIQTSNPPSDAPLTVPDGFRLIEPTDTWAGGLSFMISTWEFGAGGGQLAFEIDNNPLPLNLLKFKAEKNGDRSVLLNWETVNEIGTSHFIVQRSEDGHNWTDIGSVDAAGQSAEVRKYSFMDRNVYDGKRPSARFLYRLMMIDLDSKYGFSNIDVVKFSAEGRGTSVFVYPNPSSIGLNVEFDTSVDGLVPANMELFNTLGALIYSRKLTEGTEIEYIHYATSNIPSGTLFLRVTDADGQMISQDKIVVTR